MSISTAAEAVRNLLTLPSAAGCAVCKRHAALEKRCTACKQRVCYKCQSGLPLTTCAHARPRCAACKCEKCNRCRIETKRAICAVCQKASCYTARCFDCGSKSCLPCRARSELPLTACAHRGASCPLCKSRRCRRCERSAFKHIRKKCDVCTKQRAMASTCIACDGVSCVTCRKTSGLPLVSVCGHHKRYPCPLCQKATCSLCLRVRQEEDCPTVDLPLSPPPSLPFDVLLDALSPVDSPSKEDASLLLLLPGTDEEELLCTSDLSPPPPPANTEENLLCTSDLSSAPGSPPPLPPEEINESFSCPETSYQDPPTFDIDIHGPPSSDDESTITDVMTSTSDNTSSSSETSSSSDASSSSSSSSSTSTPVSAPATTGVCGKCLREDDKYLSKACADCGKQSCPKCRSESNLPRTACGHMRNSCPCCESRKCAKCHTDKQPAYDPRLLKPVLSTKKKFRRTVAVPTEPSSPPPPPASPAALTKACICCDTESAPRSICAECREWSCVACRHSDENKYLTGCEHAYRPCPNCGGGKCTRCAKKRRLDEEEGGKKEETEEGPPPPKKIKVDLENKVLASVNAYFNQQALNYHYERKAQLDLYKESILKHVETIRVAADLLMADADEAKCMFALPTANEIKSDFQWASQRMVYALHRQKPKTDKVLEEYVDHLVKHVPAIITWANGDVHQKAIVEAPAFSSSSSSAVVVDMTTEE